jgi:uncharacterized hydrophobic protein (TIGR00341 family)
LALRLLIVDVPEDLGEIARDTLSESGAIEVWDSPGGSFGHQVQAVIGADRTGAALDSVHERLSHRGGYRTLVLPLDAVLPRPAASAQAEEREDRASAASVSREEVYASVSGGAKLKPAFVAMAILATVVCGIGLTRDNTAAVIGAMVVAPLLGPNMALALALTLGDGLLVRRSLRCVGVGLAVVFSSALALGFLVSIDPSVPELRSRTMVAFGDMVLAVAAGAAGTLAYTSGAPTYLVGVMVAVALLPPTVASGLFVGSGYLREAGGATLLVAVNLVAVVFAAMLTFLAAGMRPRVWWKEKRAKESARRAALVLGLLLSLLLLLVWASAGLLGGGA